MFNAISSTDITEFISELALLLETNLSCKEALETLQQGQEKSAMQELIKAIQQEVERSGQLAAGFAHYPHYFKPVIVEMLRESELQGHLPATLRKIADYRESSDSAINEFIARLTLTSIYPTVLVLFTSVVILVLLIFPVPIFADMFKGFGAELPTPTRIIVQLSDFVVRYLGWILATLFIFAGYLEFLRRNGQLILKTPFFGKLFHKAMIIRFLRGYALLYSPTVSPVKTVEGCIQLMDNAFYANRLRQMSEQLNAGKSFPEVLAQFSYFPKKIGHIAIVGLKTQKLDELFNKMAARYTQQLQRAIEPTIRIFFVVTIVFLGLLIGFLIIAMYMPIFKMGSII